MGKRAVLIALVFFSIPFFLGSQSISLFNQGVVLYDSGRYLESIDFFLAALEENPFYSKAQRALVFAAFKTGDMALTAESLDRYRGRNSDSEVLQLEAQMYLSLGLIDDATGALAAAANAGGQESEEFWLLSYQLAEVSGDNSAKARALEQLRRLNSHHYDIISAMDLLDSQLWEQAFTILDPIIDSQELAPVFLVEAAASALEGMARPSAAVELLRSFEGRYDDEEDRLLRSILGRMLLNYGRPQEALQYLRPPSMAASSESAYGYAYGLYRAGLYDLAMDFGLSFFDQHRDADQIQLLLEQIFLSLGDQLNSDYGQALAQYRLEEFEYFSDGFEYNEAMVAIERALNLAPQWIEARLALVDFYINRGEDFRVYHQLETLAQEQQLDRFRRDQLEGYGASQSDSPQFVWSVDDYGVDFSPLDTLVVSIPGNLSDPYVGMATVFATGLVELAQERGLLRNTGGLVLQVPNRSRALAEARQSGVPYVMVIDYTSEPEMSGQIKLQVDVYYASQGKLIRSIPLIISGPYKLTRGFQQILRVLSQDFEPLGKIVARRGNRILLGSAHSDVLEASDELVIVPRDSIGPDRSRFSWEYNQQSIVGRAVPVNRGGYLVEADLSFTGFSDTITIGDYIFPLGQQEDQEKEFSNYQINSSWTQRYLNSRLPNRVSLR